MEVFLFGESYCPAEMSLDIQNSLRRIPDFIPDSPFMCLNHHAGQQIVELPNFSSHFTAVVNPVLATELSNFPIAQAANRSPQALVG